MKRRYIEHMVENSLVSGYDYGRYPFHQCRYFRHFEKTYGIYPIRLLSFGESVWHRECLRTRVQSDILAVEYVQEGVFVFIQNRSSHTVHAGEIFLVQPDMDSSIRCETETARKKTVIMQGPLLRQTLNLIGLAGKNRIIPTETERINMLFERIFDMGKSDGSASFRDICAQSHALLLELASLCQGMNQPLSLRMALEYIYENLSRHLNLSELSRRAGVSRATLQRQFQKHLKSSPVKYYLEAKMEKAAGLLGSRFYSVKEIVAELNYSSSQYFSREFKKRYGVTPAKFSFQIANKSVPSD